MDKHQEKLQEAIKYLQSVINLESIPTDDQVEMAEELMRIIKEEK